MKLTSAQMYKSVSIRDSRQSLELNASLWRLSWITFIFLPLTFLVGFFGMNVGLFEHHPSIKYYFITAVPLVSCSIPGCPNALRSS
jgi:Mg2+ and Co2+ transporter CorA